MFFLPYMAPSPQHTDIPHFTYWLQNTFIINRSASNKSCGLFSKQCFHSPGGMCPSRLHYSVSKIKATANLMSRISEVASTDIDKAAVSSSVKAFSVDVSPLRSGTGENGGLELLPPLGLFQKVRRQRLKVMFGQRWFFRDIFWYGIKGRGERGKKTQEIKECGF